MKLKNAYSGLSQIKKDTFGMGSSCLLWRVVRGKENQLTKKQVTFIRDQQDVRQPFPLGGGVSELTGAP